jgi:hypothetical protein
MMDCQWERASLVGAEMIALAESSCHVLHVFHSRETFSERAVAKPNGRRPGVAIFFSAHASLSFSSLVSGLFGRLRGLYTSFATHSL